MGVATTYNPGSMSRFNASLLFALVVLVSPAFSAEPTPGTTPQEDIDPATGLARSTIVRPLQGVAPPPVEATRPAAPVAPVAPAKRAHIALVLPTTSAALGKLAEAVRLGFATGAEAAGKESLPVTFTAIENEGAPLLEACRQAQAAGALVVVGGLTRDGAHALAASDCPRQPVLALNEPRGELPPTVHAFSLSLEQEARHAALNAVNDGFKSAIVLHTASPLSKRVQEAFEREWTRAAGEARRLAYSGLAEDAPALRDKVVNSKADMVFFALDWAEARDVRPYVPATLPVYATTMSVNPRAEAIVNVDLQGVRYGEMPWFLQPDHPAVMAYSPPRTALSVEQERLYAFGIDAFRLALQIVKGEAKAPLDGVTGRLVLEGNRVYNRVLLPAEVDGGKVIPLRPAQ